MVLVYRDIILLCAIGVGLLLILLALVVPVCFRACYNRYKCCRGCYRCKCAKPKSDEYEDVGVGEWVTSNGADPPSNGSGGGSGEPRSYRKLFEPSIHAQVFVYICIGFLFVAICALTDVPFYVIWILMFLVWTILFIDFLKRQHAKQILDGGIDMTSFKKENKKEKFDAYEAAGIKRTHFKAVAKRYLNSCALAIRVYKWEFLVAIVSIIVISFIVTISSSCMCITASPVRGSTFLSRHFGHKYCVSGSVCNVYFTLADQESDLIMNFHASEKPDAAYVVYDVVSHERNSSETIEEWVDTYPSHASATVYKVNTVWELERYVMWADISDLQADTYYFFVAVYIKDGVTVASNEYKVRSLPSNGDYTFITGGDMSNDDNAKKLIDHAAETNPNFAVIGGDNAYDNGFAACYLRWDEWFDRWNKLMTKNGSTVPVILTIGNHEAGSFGASLGDDPYYTSYFPQKLGLQDVNPRKRMPYHVHRIGNDTTIIMLDSDVVVRVEGEQTDWLEAQLAVPSKLKIVVYHANIYPSSDIVGVLGNKGKKYWAPLFDKYNVTMAFEHHLHLYKRTKPLRNDQVDPDGVTYFGDGTWGVMPNIIPLSNAFYIQTVHRKQHFFHVSVQNNQNISVNAIDKDGDIFDSWNKYLA